MRDGNDFPDPGESPGPRIAPDGGPEADDPAQGRGDARRSAGVGADAGGREPRCDSGCVAAAAAARDLGRVVRIAHRPERAIVAGDAERQLVHVGLAEENAAGAEQGVEDVRVRARAVAAEAWRSSRGGQRRAVDVVLDKQRQSVQRTQQMPMSPGLVGGSGRFQDLLRNLGDQHVEIPERAGPPQQDGGVGLGPEISGSHCRQGLGGRQLQHLAPCRRGGVCKGPTRTGQAASYEKL